MKLVDETQRGSCAARNARFRRWQRDHARQCDLTIDRSLSPPSRSHSVLLRPTHRRWRATLRADFQINAAQHWHIDFPCRKILPARRSAAPSLCLPNPRILSPASLIAQRPPPVDPRDARSSGKRCQQASMPATRRDCATSPQFQFRRQLADVIHIRRKQIPASARSIGPNRSTLGPAARRSPPQQRAEHAMNVPCAMKFP